MVVLGRTSGGLIIANVPGNFPKTEVPSSNPCPYRLTCAATRWPLFLDRPDLLGLVVGSF